MELHNFHSSSTSFRVRIALNLKGLPWEYRHVGLAFRDSPHETPDYRSFNPQGNVPVLVDGDHKIMQSLAICEYLDETHPEPPLLPRDPAGRARVRGIALWVACDIQGPNNLRIERYLHDELRLYPDAMRAWRRRWIENGFDAIERLLDDPATGRFIHGDRPTLADCFLIPQAYNAQRPTVGFDLSRWPRIRRVWDACLAEPAFERALPRNQPGYTELKEH